MATGGNVATRLARLRPRGSPGRNDHSGYLFIAPAVVLILVFSVVAMAFSLYISFHRWDILNPQQPFVGLANFQRAFSTPLVGTAELPAAGRGATRPVVHRGSRVGAVVRTRDRVAPVYVSVGHRIALPTAVEWVLRCGAGFRIPEPTRSWASSWALKEACRGASYSDGDLIEPQGVVRIGETKSFSRPSRNLIFQEIVPFFSSRSVRTLWPRGAKSA